VGRTEGERLELRALRDSGAAAIWGALPALLLIAAGGMGVGGLVAGLGAEAVTAAVWAPWLAGALGFAVAAIVAQVVLGRRKAGGHGQVPTGESLWLDRAGRAQGAWGWNLTRATSVTTAFERGRTTVRVHTARCPRGVGVVVEEPCADRARRVAEALARQLRVDVAAAPAAGGSLEAEIRCPQCDKRMVSLSENGITVDRCKRCKRLWLDGGELEVLAGPEAVGALERAAPGEKSALACPRDGDALVGHELEPLRFHVCPTCEGLLIDKDTVRALRAEAKAQRANRRRQREAVQGVQVTLQVVGGLLKLFR
jgi:Zn-finger nucleic acid-binding protein